MYGKLHHLDEIQKKSFYFIDTFHEVIGLMFTNKPECAVPSINVRVSGPDEEIHAQTHTLPPPNFFVSIKYLLFSSLFLLLYTLLRLFCRISSKVVSSEKIT